MMGDEPMSGQPSRDKLGVQCNVPPASAGRKRINGSPGSFMLVRLMAFHVVNCLSES